MKTEDKSLEHTRPEGSSGFLLWQTSNLRQRKINVAFSDIDLTYPQFVILKGIDWLNRDNKLVNQVMLINFTKMDKSVVSSILKLLEKKKIVVRKTDPKDTRAKVLELNKAGKFKLKDAMEIIIDQDNEFFGIGSENGNKLNELLLDILIKNGYQYS